MGYLPNKYISSHPGNVNEFWANFDNLSLQCYNKRQDKKFETG